MTTPTPDEPVRRAGAPRAGQANLRLPKPKPSTDPSSNEQSASRKSWNPFKRTSGTKTPKSQPRVDPALAKAIRGQYQDPDHRPTAPSEPKQKPLAKFLGLHVARRRDRSRQDALPRCRSKSDRGHRRNPLPDINDACRTRCDRRTNTGCDGWRDGKEAITQRLSDNRVRRRSDNGCRAQGRDGVIGPTFCGTRPEREREISSTTRASLAATPTQTARRKTFDQTRTLLGRYRFESSPNRRKPCSPTCHEAGWCGTRSPHTSSSRSLNPDQSVLSDHSHCPLILRSKSPSSLSDSGLGSTMTFCTRLSRLPAWHSRMESNVEDSVSGG